VAAPSPGGDDVMTAEPVHRTILVLDIVDFAHPIGTSDV
jgi:hypothetical protein